MKENWKKTSLLYRIIAVVLTFIMVGTTLYFHFEKRYDAKADGDYIEVIPVFLPVNNKDNGTNSSGNINISSDGWIILDTDKSINTSEADRKYAYILKIKDDRNILTKISIEKSGGEAYTDTNNTPAKITIDENSGDGTRQYTGYMIEVDTPASTNTNPWKFKYDITINNGENATNESNLDGGTLPVFNCTNAAVTTSISADFGDVSKPFDNSGNYYIGEGTKLNIKVKSGKKLTELTVLDNNFTLDEIENGLKKYDIQTCTYEYEYEYDFDLKNNENNNYTNKAIRAKADGDSSAVEITCGTLFYDKSMPIIEENPENLVTGQIYKGTYVYNYKITSGEYASEKESEIIEANYNDGSDHDIVGSLTGTVTFHESDSLLGTNIHFYAKDKAENETNKEVTVIVDNTLPIVTSAKITKGENEYHLNGLGSTYFKPSDIFTAIATDNLDLREISVCDDSDLVITSKAVSGVEGTYSDSLYKILGKSSIDELTDGDYAIKVYAYDNATVNQNDAADILGNKSSIIQEGTIKIDGTKPVVDVPATLIYRAPEDGTIKEFNNISDGICSINKENITLVYYRVKISDALSGVDPNSLALKIGDTKVAGNSALDGEYYYFEVPVTNTTYQPLGIPVTYTITAADYAGNEIVIDGLTKVKVIDPSITVTNAILTNKVTGEPIASLDTLGAVGPYSNVIYTLTVTATSGNPLTEIGLKDNSGIIDVKSGANITNNYDEASKLYTSVVSIDIPADGLNKAYNQLKVFAKDGVHTDKEVSIGLLIYDSTLPIVRLVANKADKIVTDNEWHKSFPLSFTVWSGIRDEESPLTIAGYTITGTDAGADVTEKAYSLNGNQNSQADTINIPESNNIGGTTITFRATDSATNSMLGTTDDPISFTIKVDATDPVIDSLTAAGNEENTIPLAGDPSIAAGFSDNLTLGKATFTVSLPDGTTKTYDIADADSEEKNISMSKSYKISEIIGSEPADGNYKVKLSVEDKAGNSAAEKEIRFAIDNTPPMFTADIVSGSSVKNNSYYNTAVTVRLTVDDNNFDSDKISITDNGQAVSLDNSWQIEDGIRVGTITIPQKAVMT